MKISHDQIDAVRVSDIFGSEIPSRLENPALCSRPKSELSEVEWDELEDACMDALQNESPEVETCFADQGTGLYPITILGIKGAYFVTANEFDRAGVFSTLEEARDHIDNVHGEFLVDPDAEIEESEEEIEDDALLDDSVLESDLLEPISAICAEAANATDSEVIMTGADRFRPRSSRRVVISERNSREELLRRGWVMRGAWAERTIGSTRLVVSGTTGDDRSKVLSFHPSFSRNTRQAEPGNVQTVSMPQNHPSKFDPYKDMVEFYDSLTDEQKAELKAQGIC